MCEILDRLRGMDNACGVRMAALGGPLEEVWHRAVRELPQEGGVLQEGGVYRGAWLESTGTIGAEVLTRFLPSVARETLLLSARHRREDGLLPYKVTGDGHDNSPRFWHVPDTTDDGDPARCAPDSPILPFLAPDLTANVACQRRYLARIAVELGEDAQPWERAAGASEPPCSRTATTARTACSTIGTPTGAWCGCSPMCCCGCSRARWAMGGSSRARCGGICSTAASSSRGTRSRRSPAILWTIDAVERLSGILPRPGGEVWFTGLTPVADAVGYARRIDGVGYESVVTRSGVVVYRDRREHAGFPHGWRLVTDRAGTPRAVIGMSARTVRGTLVTEHGPQLDLAVAGNERVDLDGGGNIVARTAIGVIPPNS